MDIQDVVRQAQDAMTVRRVTGDPYEKNGITLISVAAIRGGWGAGAGTGPAGEGEGGGGGFGMVARPVGAYVIRGEQVTWQPALDVNRIIVGGQMVAIVALLTLRTVVRARSRRAFLRASRRRRRG
jgi:uncharacterized spore protein YtfJ